MLWNEKKVINLVQLLLCSFSEAIESESVATIWPHDYIFSNSGKQYRMVFQFYCIMNWKKCAIILNLLKQIFLGTVLQLNIEQISDVATKVCVVYNIS